MASSKVALLIFALSLLVLAAHGASYYAPGPGSIAPPSAAPPSPTAPAPAPPAPTPPSADNRHRGICKIDALKLTVCVSVLDQVLGNPLGYDRSDAHSKCCPLLEGVAQFDAELCLCTAVNGNLIYGFSIAVLLNECGKLCPADFICRY